VATNDAPLAGVRVLDLSRILAAPLAAQLLGDLGAEVIKVERPGDGDDSRRYGPPFLPDAEGMFRVHTPQEAARALDAVAADYERHCRAARALAEQHFDANAVVGRMLEAAL